MPLYEYTCRDCGKRFEVLQRLGAGSDGLTCPACGARNVVKQFSTFASSVQGSAAAPCGAPSGSCGSGGFT
jgi:putative FmdB family regulatory protein